MGFDVALLTHRGKVRTANEDAVAVDGRIFAGDTGAVWSTRLNGGRHVLLLADGIGGHTRGDQASRAVLSFLSQRLPGVEDEVACEEVLHAANEHLYELISDVDTAPMGTTVVGVILQPKTVIHFNVGDSRAYRSGKQGLLRLTTDDRVDDEGDPAMAHVITQAMGGSLIPLGIAPHLGTVAILQAGDRLLLCSDGLTDGVADDIIGAILAERSPLDQAVEQLFVCAMAAGGRDNISILVAQPAEHISSAE